MPSIFVRRSKYPNFLDLPKADLQNGEFLTDENGNVSFVPCDPVSPSQACDYDVISNSLRGVVKSSPMRDVFDPVDAPKKFKDLI